MHIGAEYLSQSGFVSARGAHGLRQAQAERENDPLMVSLSVPLSGSNHERYPDYVGRTSFSKTGNGGLGSESLPPDVTSGRHRGDIGVTSSKLANAVSYLSMGVSSRLPHSAQEPS